MGNKKEFMKLAFKNFLQIAFIMLFVSWFSSSFGSVNQLIAVGFVTAAIMLFSLDIGIDKKQAPFVIFGLHLLIAIAITIEQYNIYIAIITNALTIFIIMILMTVKLMFRTYIPFMLMFIFAQGNPVPKDEILKRFLLVVGCGIVLSILYFIRHRKNTEETKTIQEIFKNIDMKHETSVFCIKMVIGVTIAMFIIDIFGMKRGMWISACTLALTQPHFNTSKERMKLRLIGTAIGVIGYFLLFGGFLIPQQYFAYLTAILAYVYTFIKNYTIQAIFITINALNAAQVIFNNNFHSVISRISFILLSCLIVIIIGYLEHKILDKNVEYED